MGIKTEFGQKIRRMRQKQGLTQEQLAELVDVSQRTLSAIETGDSFVTSDTFDKLVLALKTTPENLFSTSHLKNVEDLSKEISAALPIIEKDPIKLEFLYKIVQTFLND